MIKLGHKSSLVTLIDIESNEFKMNYTNRLFRIHQILLLKILYSKPLDYKEQSTLKE